MPVIWGHLGSEPLKESTLILDFPDFAVSINKTIKLRKVDGEGLDHHPFITLLMHIPSKCFDNYEHAETPVAWKMVRKTECL